VTLVGEAAWEGLLLVFSWPNILVPLLGTLLAMVFSLLPGLSGAALMALMIPLTYQWEPVPVLLLFGALVGGATFMGSATAILFNIPGTAPNAATMLDGYPMARSGKAKTALGCSAAASALGSSFGVVVLLLLIPAMAVLVTLFGPAENLMLAIWGLAMIVTVIRGSVVKGLVMAGFGLMLSFVGFDPRTSELRYTLDTLYLQDGMSLVPIFLGTFAVAEVIDLMSTGRSTISGSTRLEQLSGSALEGVRSVFRHFGLFLRSSIIGTVVGVIPGVGGTAAAFVAYGEAARSAGARGDFGRGDIRGVIAPEAANDAKDGGALLPALAFGIPGSAGTAVLIGVLALHGIRPGEDLMTSQLPLAFVLIWSLFLSNWLTSLVGLSLVSPLSRLTVVPISRVVLPILILAAAGAFAFRGRISDLWLTFAFGLVGYGMKKYAWPRVAFIIALVLGPMFELNLHLTLSLQRLGRIQFWTRPAVIGLIGLLVVTLWFQRDRARAVPHRTTASRVRGDDHGRSTDDAEAGEADDE
jgi:TctA family transporter